MQNHTIKAKNRATNEVVRITSLANGNVVEYYDEYNNPLDIDKFNDLFEVVEEEKCSSSVVDSVAGQTDTLKKEDKVIEINFDLDEKGNMIIPDTLNDPSLWSEAKECEEAISSLPPNSIWDTLKKEDKFTKRLIDKKTGEILQCFCIFNGEDLYFIRTKDKSIHVAKEVFYDLYEFESLKDKIDTELYDVNNQEKVLNFITQEIAKAREEIVEKVRNLFSDYDETDDITDRIKLIDIINLINNK